MARKTRTLVESPTGKGGLHRQDEFIREVAYRLTVSQEVTETDPGREPIKGQMEIGGKVIAPNNPIGVADLTGEELTLHLEDGRRLDLFISDPTGRVAHIVGGKGLYKPDEEENPTE